MYWRGIEKGIRGRVEREIHGEEGEGFVRTTVREGKDTGRKKGTPPRKLVVLKKSKG